MASASMTFYPKPREAAEIEENADDAGVSVSEYIRSQLEECEV